jgi:mannosyltransferase OCH1-like enzyme
MDVEKSDYYRLQHLYKYGGIYSDFDNIIDHPCLMKAL